MKLVVAYLILLSVSAAVSAITGVNRLSFSDGNIIITYHGFVSRTVVAAAGIIFGFAGYGCMKRKLYAWWIVAIMMGLLIGYAIGWTILIMLEMDLDFLGYLLGTLGQGVKIAAILWLFISWWIPKRKEFSGSVRK